MSWFKQTLLALIVLLGAGIVWLRFYPDAAELASSAGVPEIVLDLIGHRGSGTGESAGAGKGPPGAQRGGRNQASLVVVSAVGKASINDRVTAIGDGEARRSVAVVPLSSGVLEEVRVEPGQQVTKGTVLAVLDSEAEKITRDQAALTVETAQEKVSRYEQLVKSLAGTQVQLTDAKSELQKAKLVLREAQLDLDRRSIIAPISGIVGFVPVERGDYITQTSHVATIDDRSEILLDFWVPERFASLIEIGQPVEAVPISLPGRMFQGSVQAIDSRVDRDSRTLQIRAVLDNGEDLLRPGMSFKVSLRFPGEVYPAVDPLAIQWSSDGAYVWKTVDDKSQKVPVHIIQRNSDYVLVTGDLSEGEEVVVEGIQNLRPGSDLKVARRSGAPVSPGS